MLLIQIIYLILSRQKQTEKKNLKNHAELFSNKKESQSVKTSIKISGQRLFSVTE